MDSVVTRFSWTTNDEADPAPVGLARVVTWPFFWKIRVDRFFWFGDSSFSVLSKLRLVVVLSGGFSAHSLSHVLSWS